MKLTKFFPLLLIIALGLVAGCQKERSVAGPIGSSSIQGSVVLESDLVGRNPAGIEVRVRGTGLRTQTDAAGHFQLFGAPEGSIELGFSRSDGISAVLQTSGVAAQSLVVGLSSNSAHSRRRGVGHPGVEIEGVVTAVAADSISVTTEGHGDYDVAVNEDTIVRKGNQILTIADVKVGDRVHVKARQEEDKSLTAVEIKLQGGESQARTELAGTISVLGDGEFTLTDAGGTDWTIQVTDSTEIRDRNNSLTVADLQVGWNVKVLGTKVDDTTVSAIRIQVEHDGSTETNADFDGTITSIDASSFVLHTEEGMDVTVDVDSNTVIREKNQLLAFSDLAVGDEVSVEGVDEGGGAVLATRIQRSPSNNGHH
ncbi:MAG: DUF5666 domain-containing protein [Thermoanaerobaculia bacterium]